MGEESNRCLLPEERMFEMLLLPLLVGYDERLPCSFLHMHASSRTDMEVSARYLLSIDGSEHCPVRQRCPEFLHDVESQAFSSGTISVEKADLGIKSDTLASRTHVVTQNPIGKRKHGIGWIPRGTP